MKYTRASQPTSEANPSYSEANSYSYSSHNVLLIPTIIMYQLLTTISTNRVTAKQKNIWYWWSVLNKINIS